MAIFKGKNELLKSLKDAKRLQDRKGIGAEIEVGDLLSKYLDENTYIIAQPDIGELQPDFLIISPDYGFRLIEIKNLSISYIEDVLSNGLLKTKFGNQNPLRQVKSHAEALKNYLVSNYSNFIRDPFKDIGYCVIHKGFSKKEFEYKFAKSIGNWSPKEQDCYYKHHLFFEEISGDIDQFLAKATKFPNQGFYLDNQHLELIANEVNISPFKKDADGYIERFNEHEEKIAHVNEELMQIKERINIYQHNSTNHVNTNKKINNRKFKWVAFPIISVFLILTAFIITNNPFNIGNKENSASEYTEVFNSFVNLEDYIDEYVKIEALVSRFYYDNNSGTKFLTLYDGNWHIDAVIFKDTKVPFIEEGQSYVFEGYIQSTLDNKEIELNVKRIE